MHLPIRFAQSLYLRRWILLAALLPWFGPTPALAGSAQEDFGSLVQLAPFVVQGRQLSISIHARTKTDRCYAQAFAEGVVQVVCETVTPETGRGLVIIGQKGEPHPILVLRRFLTLAESGQLDPAVAARAPELEGTLTKWEVTINKERADSDDLEAEKIIMALPLSLQGLSAQLYQLAWTEKFSEAKVDARLRALHAPDLEGTLFKPYDWVFYLPPKKAFDHALDEVVNDALKEDDAGFFTRVAAKGVIMAVKPRIRRAIEAVRRGLLFQTVVEARTTYAETQLDELTDAYIEALMPDSDNPDRGLPEHDRAVKAVEACLDKLASDAVAATQASSDQ